MVDYERYQRAYSERAREKVPDEDVLGAWLFYRTGGYASMPFSHISPIVGTVIRTVGKKRAAGFPNTFMLVVTPTKVRAYKAKLRRGDAKLGDELAVWDRAALQVSVRDAALNTEVVIESLVTEVIVFASRLARKSGNRWAERARRLIEEEFASPLSLGGIASAVGVHPVHLARQFRAAHGCTVGEYIRRVRVAFARRELVMTDKPIAEIALSAGFFDQSQLTKTFKRVTGRTPAAYRAQHR